MLHMVDYMADKYLQIYLLKKEGQYIPERANSPDGHVLTHVFIESTKPEMQFKQVEAPEHV